MSYILDALKKSEKEKKKNTMPDATTLLEPVAGKSKKRTFLLYLIFAALILNAGVFLLIMYTGKSEKAQHQVISSSKIHDSYLRKDSGETTILKSEKPSNDHFDPDKTEREAEKKNIEVIPRENSDSNIASVKNSLVSEEATLTRTTAVKDTKEAQIAEELTPPTQNKLYGLNELPQVIVEKLPDFNITMSVYSDNPSERMVRINGETLREGEFLKDGLKLEEITPDAVILSYMKYRFQVHLR